MVDFRSPGAHDVDRVLYSSAYRRLTGVTQVVAVGERQLFHNRLTHTQKVAQLARRIAQHLNAEPQFAQGRQNLPGGLVDEDVSEAAGLAHDLGHPPFGHIAESALNQRCLIGNADGYEGNAQSFRIVTKLSVRRAGAGLSLSQPTLNAILKYPWLSTHPLAASKEKWGAYETERLQFEYARNGDRSTNKSVEAEIMDWADDISYAIHDLEDFYRAGFIQLRDVSQDPGAQEDFVAKALLEWKGPSWPFDEALRIFQDLLFLMPDMGRFAGTKDDREQVNRLGSVFIDRYVTASEITAEGTFAVDSGYHREIHLLKQLTWQYVINDPSLATLQQGQVLVVEDLFDALLDWQGSEKRTQRLPTRFRDLAELALQEAYASDDARNRRVVADYISSLTEDQAIDLHARLRGRTRGSIQDTWVSY